jgi:hypothetical protein
MPFSCFNSSAEAIWLNVETAEYANTSDTTLVRQFYYSDVYADICVNNGAAASLAPYIGTAAVARDMMQIVDALDQGDKLNYWGTFLLAKSGYYRKANSTDTHLH